MGASWAEALVKAASESRQINGTVVEAVEDLIIELRHCVNEVFGPLNRRSDSRLVQSRTTSLALFLIQNTNLVETYLRNLFGAEISPRGSCPSQDQQSSVRRSLWLDVSLRDDGSAQASHFTVRHSLGLGGSPISGSSDPTASAAEWDDSSESVQIWVWALLAV